MLFGLGIMYSQGANVVRDYAAAAKCYRKAVGQSVARAQHILGNVYRRGEGVAQDSQNQGLSLTQHCARHGLHATLERSHELTQAQRIRSSRRSYPGSEFPGWHQLIPKRPPDQPVTNRWQ